MQARRTFGYLVAAFLLALVWQQAAEACNVPVFRYALERWRPDTYRMVIVHRGALHDSQLKLVEQLRRTTEDGLANGALVTVELDELGAAAEKLIGDHSAADLPRLIVQYPARLGSDVPIWSAPFTTETVARLIDSPARQELTRRLIRGQSAVWIVLESGDRDADEAAAQLVERQLRKLEAELKLPQLTDDPVDKLATAPPLVLEFSLLRVARSEVEEPLVRMLLRSEPDLAELKQPLVFPVFGRGRAMFPLVGAGITADNLRDFACFLVGACSCQVKEFNPGFDLLIAANWEEMLAPAGQRSTFAATTQQAGSTEPQLVPIPGRTSHDERQTTPVLNATAPSGTRSHVRLILMTGIVAGVALGVICGLVGLTRWRSTTSTRG